MDYLIWNDAIGAYFFNSERGGSRVFLYVTIDVLTKIGVSYDVNCDDFIAAVKVGPPWNTRQGRGLCQQALQAFENWRSRTLDYPPYLGYLALFVLADSVDVGFARHSYYPGLRSLLGEEPETGMYPSFHQMYHLWEDLAFWSNQDKHGDWGSFNADIVGEWRHVGMPRAQTLLTDEERDNLPTLFADNGFDPHSPPSDREIAYLLADDPNHRLRPYTKRLLTSINESDSPIRAALAALIEVLLDELEHWDESVPEQPNIEGQVRRSLGNLRLAMVLDRTARVAQFFLRCRSSREYPDEGLQFTGSGIPEPLYCYQDWQGWSTPLSGAGKQSDLFDPSYLDWREGLSLIDNEHAWKATLSKRAGRVMVSAKPFGFDGFVEESQIPRDKPFCLLAHDSYRETLHKWGEAHCKGFSAIDLISGLPRGWHLYSIEHANSDTIIQDIFPYLAFATVPRIQLRGGLKLRGNQYFTFALPQVEVIGAADDICVYSNGHKLERNPETGIYNIPDKLRANRIIIEVRHNEEWIAKRTLYALETTTWRDIGQQNHFDKFGRRISGDSVESYVGAIINGVTSPDFYAQIFLPPSAGLYVYFIGRNPGEIVECPPETIPEAWQPVWAVQMQKRGRGKGSTIYCGKDLTNEQPSANQCNNRKKLRLWKEILWYRRKRVADPSRPILNTLWRRYKEVAFNVR